MNRHVQRSWTHTRGLLALIGIFFTAVLGYANDYSMGYVLTREDYDMAGLMGLGGSERGQCVFGKQAGPMCMKIVWDLVNSIREADSSDVFIYAPGDMPQKKPALPPSLTEPTVQK